MAAAAMCVPAFAAEETTNVPVKMTYIDKSNPDESFGEIAAGSTAKTGFNTIKNGVVEFGNEGWGVNYITYLQVNVSEIEGSILNATLSFEASEGSDGKRTQTYGVGYNDSVWSSKMTYNTANRSITLMGDTQSGTVKYADRFKTFSFDITEAVLNAENGLATVIIYETVAAGGDVKNPEVVVKWTDEATYDVTFKETNEVEATITVNNLDVTTGTSLPDGNYTFTATATGYKDYTGEFTVDGKAEVVEFAMTPKAVWNWTAKSSVDTEIGAGTCFEGEAASVPFCKYILKDGTVWSKDAINKEFKYTFTPDADNYVATLDYTENADNGIFYVEGENIEGMSKGTEGQASARNSNAAGGYASEPVTVCTLFPGTYKMEVAYSGNSGATFKINLGEDAEEPLLTCTTKGYWESSTADEIVIAAETTVIVECEGSTNAKTLDYILITGKGGTTSAVKAIETVAADGKWYNLQGVQIAAPAKGGLYIHNGKKVIVK